MQSRAFTRQVAALLLVAVFAASPREACLGAEEDAAEAIPQLVKRVRPCVVLLTTTDGAGNPVGSGTGFFISADGRVLTNHHVLLGASSVSAVTSDGASLPVEGVLAADEMLDLAILKVPGERHPFLRLSSLGPPDVGTRILVVGNPLGLDGTVSEGIVSALRKEGPRDLVQIGAAISPGSSGSPVVTLDGVVVGVAQSSMVEGQALNFAVPSSAVARLTVEPKPLPIGTVATAWGSGNDAMHTSPEWKAVRATWGRGSDWLEATSALLARYPKVAYAHAVHGEALAGLRLYEDALNALRRAIELCPK